ncbi:MAG TPA: hypothetical protein VKU84_02185 [Stellaceae bacterium]|nr:hypothetical protein [Stellaceae bacterium]
MTSTLHNYSAGDLVDELGALKADLANLKSREDAIRAELIGRGVTEAEGALFRATITEATRWTLDTDRVKAEMGQAWYEGRCKIGTATTVRVSARTGIRKAA